MNKYFLCLFGNKRAMTIIVDPALYNHNKLETIGATEERNFPSALQAMRCMIIWYALEFKLCKKFNQ